MRPRSLVSLSIAILIPIALGATYAVGTGGDSGPAAATLSERAGAIESMKAGAQAVASAHRIARAKCGHLGAVERGNCRTEARAEAKRALKAVMETEPRV